MAPNREHLPHPSKRRSHFRQQVLCRVHPLNPRYFADGSGKAILLAGTHTWRDLQAFGAGNPPGESFDYPGYLGFLRANNLNFTRLWSWEQSKAPAGYPPEYLVAPLPYLRPGTGTAQDGLPKFDLSQFNQAYFDRLRQRVIDAGNQGIYVDIQLFNGWSVGTKDGSQTPWTYHPFNSSNNINGIDGDANDDGEGYEIETLSLPAITALQDAYVKKVIDTVNDLDNVLFEICNESEPGAAYVAWHNHMIDLIHSYEATKPKQHVVGFSVPYSSAANNNGNNSGVFSSNADWVAPNEYDSAGYNYKSNPRPNSGSKVIIADTDHLWGLGGDRSWAWKSFTRGLNLAYMDCYVEDALGCPISQSDSARLSLLANLGYALRYADRMNLAAMTPRGDLCSTGYCLANPTATGAEYLVYLPSGGSITVNLTSVSEQLMVEWFNPSTGVTTAGGSINGGANRSFTPPFGGDAVLYLRGSVPPTPTPTHHFYLPLVLGWNLIAVPLIPADTTPSAVFASIAGDYDAVFGYDGCDSSDPWKSYRPDSLPVRNDLTAITLQQGIWIRTTRQVTMALSGIVPSTVDIPLCSGWNLISYPVSTPRSLPVALAGIAGKHNSVYAYDAADTANSWKSYDPTAPPAANDLNALEAGRGYWIEATGAITLTVIQ